MKYSISWLILAVHLVNSRLPNEASVKPTVVCLWGSLCNSYVHLHCFTSPLASFPHPRCPAVLLPKECTDILILTQSLFTWKTTLTQCTPKDTQECSNTGGKPIFLGYGEICCTLRILKDNVRAMNDFSFHILTLKLNFLIKSNSTLNVKLPNIIM